MTGCYIGIAALDEEILQHIDKYQTKHEHFECNNFEKFEGAILVSLSHSMYSRVFTTNFPPLVNFCQWFLDIIEENRM